jgi:predicted ATPase/class 3 adenylate cyclase
MDRRQALARGEDLPERTYGAALFADISGFTALTEALLKEHGEQGGAEKLTWRLNRIFDGLVAKVDDYGGSVTTFGGDALTCWFDGDSSTLPMVAEQAALRAVACALAMQKAMSGRLSATTQSLAAGPSIPLSMKAAIASGPARRLRVGDPSLHFIDVLAGATLDKMAAAEKHAHKGEVVLSAETARQLADKVDIKEWRDADGCALITGLKQPVNTARWPTLAVPAATDWTEPIPEAELRPWFLAPVYERLRYGESLSGFKDQFLSEIRSTVVLFLNFGGLDYDADDTAGAKLDAYLRWVQATLAKYEGYLLQFILGDKGAYLYATFGAPVAHPDDPARAVTAALELRQPPPALDFIRDTHLGISQGRLWAGAYGGATRRTYGVLGDEVNVAARLMGKAAPGQILVSEKIATACALKFDFRPVGALELKGKSEPLPTLEVVGLVVPTGGAIARFTARLVGRDADLARLRPLLDSALAGNGQILRLEGQPGVGKSHFSAALAQRAQARGLRVVSGACYSLTQNSAYAPWREILWSLLELTGVPAGDSQIAQVEQAVRAADPDWLVRLPLLADVLGLPLEQNATTSAREPEARQAALFDFIGDLIRRWASVKPLFLLIEDVQWMDGDSQALTLKLAQGIAQAPVMLTLTQRPPLQADEPPLAKLHELAYHQMVNLGDLSPEGATALIASQLENRASALVLALIQMWTRGNALFIKELLDSLRETGRLYRRDDGLWILSRELVEALRAANCLVSSKDPVLGEWTLSPHAPLSDAALGLRDTTQKVVTERFDRLLERHKVTLKVASVIGPSFDLGLLTPVHPAHPPEADLRGQLEVLTRQSFTEAWSPVRYAFYHEIAREAIYSTLPLAQQHGLHCEIGRALEQLRPEAYAELAYHYTRGELRDKALFYLDKAARDAQHRYAYESALDYFQKALALDPQQPAWRQAEIDILHSLGRREAELAALATLAALPQAPVHETDYRYGRYYEAIGDYPAALDAAELALATYRNRDQAVGQMQCLILLGLIERKRGNYPNAKDWYAEALALTEATPTPTAEAERVLAQTLNGLGIVHRQIGAFDAARQNFQRALDLSQASGDLYGQAEAFDNLGTVAYRQRAFALAEKEHKQALERWKKIGQHAREGTTLYNLALIAQDAGEYGRAEEYFTRAIQLHQSINNRFEEGNVWNGRGILHQYLGDFKQARECYEKAADIARAIGDEAGEAYVKANLGLVMREIADLEQAEQWLTESLTAAQALQEKELAAYCYSCLATVSVLTGELARAREQAQIALTLREELAQEPSMPDDLATLVEIYLALDDLPEALDYAQQTLAILAKHHGQGAEFAHRDYFVCYLALQMDGQMEAAHAALGAAYQWVMERAGKIADPARRQLFLEGVPVNRQIITAAREQGVS